MKQIILAMADLFSQGQSFALATVISRLGSAPRSAGARMLIRMDGSAVGTVGGGILEAQVEQLARQVMASHQGVVMGFSFSGEDAASMDAICGGQVEVLVEWLDATDPQETAMVAGMTAAAAGHGAVWLATGLPGGKYAGKHALLDAGGSVTGYLPLGLDVQPLIDKQVRGPQLFKLDEGEGWVEPLDMGGTVFIFGAGHVSRSLAGFTRAVGFHTVVLDDRSEYPTPERFPGADELIVLDSFEGALEKVRVERDSYIVIVTRGHLHDQVVLAQALRTQAVYVGMIGSRRKCGLIFDALRKEGFTDEDIHRVHAPIGLPIQAETPEEIGVSIVAEMIQVRAETGKSTRV